MSYERVSLKKYLGMIAAPSAVPGGGSVAAYAGALGSALGAMACGITIKKRFTADPQGPVGTQRAQSGSSANLDTFTTACKQFHHNYETLLKLSAEDSASYQKVLDAYAIPRYVLHRRTRINQALKGAAEVPLKVMELCVRNLKTINDFKHLFPTAILSDVNVSVLLNKAALQGARLNVLTNIETISDKKMGKYLENKLEELDKLLELTLYQLEEWA